MDHVVEKMALQGFSSIEETDNAAINIIPDSPLTGCIGGNIGDFPILAIKINLFQERGISSLSGTGRLKKHTKTLIIATQMCPSAGALARMNC